MATELEKIPQGPNWVPLRWASTTAPKAPFTLPAFVRLRVTQQEVLVQPVTTAGPSDEEKPEVHIARSEIVGVEIKLLPDWPYSDHLHESVERLSHAILRHRDPFGVVPFFENTFVSPKAYWIKALAKVLREQFGIRPADVLKSG